MSQDYNGTLNLPKTEFSMRAALPQREPEMLKVMEEQRLYYKMVERNAGKPLYVLHDGPPYANGDIHLGTALNKVLKDIIVKYKNMSGFQAPYVPGWDTHGLPIELKAMKKIGAQNIGSPVDLRRHCREFALTYMENQKAQFKRLGVLGDFEDPYLTLKPEFEAKQIEVFGEMAKKGYIYKGLKPVYWCPECKTALAEAEIEYAEDPCYSIYVKFSVTKDNGKLASLGADLSKTYFVIWTTTTWTLPGNVAICLGPDYEYCVVKAKGECYVMAKELVPAAMKAAKIQEYEISEETVLGKELEHIVTKHPFINRNSPIIVGAHVTLESGTGCVHTAPGHGVEDFEVCRNYPDLPIVVPVDSLGVLTKEAGEFAGLATDEANKKIAAKLEETGHLFAIEKIIHQYPHCWRCKSPILFRATEQWFCSVDGFKEDAVKAVKSVEWIPAWGEDRIESMVRDRSDWCISRQRTWGVPIPIFYCADCGKYVVNDESIKAVSALFAKEGSDAWYKRDAMEILPSGFTCPHCGGKKFTKENDIMDVWFDSGVSHAAVLNVRENLRWPADLYLEGADQYRGWFQSSLLTSVAWKGVAPYKAVCTHGWVVDGEGRKMSKSLGNGIAPEDIIKEYGADVLRLWVASSDYHADIRISKDILKQLSEVYRKVRNTARYILGNIYDFNPDTDAVAYDELPELDRWALMRLDDLITKVTEAYDRLEFHIVYHALHNFCVVDMSNFYLDVIKDRLYVEAAGSKARHSAQTAMHLILSALTRLLAPILAFTADEIWSFMPESKAYNKGSVLFNDMPKPFKQSYDPAFVQKWEKISLLHDDVKKELENLRAEKIIGKSLDAKLTLYAEGEAYEFIKSVEGMLPDIFIVSQVEVVNGKGGDMKGEFEGVAVSASKADGTACVRCLAHSTTVGSDAQHPELCSRCRHIIEEL